MNVGDNMKKIIYIISIFLIGINLIYAKETVKFSSCIDGDTFKVSINGEIKTVRMLAIDTPETEKPEKTPLRITFMLCSAYTIFQKPSRISFGAWYWFRLRESPCGCWDSGWASKT